jgi:hypothetical protein
VLGLGAVTGVMPRDEQHLWSLGVLPGQDDAVQPLGQRFSVPAQHDGRCSHGPEATKNDHDDANSPAREVGEHPERPGNRLGQGEVPQHRGADAWS